MKPQESNNFSENHASDNPVNEPGTNCGEEKNLRENNRLSTDELIGKSSMKERPIAIEKGSLIKNLFIGLFSILFTLILLEGSLQLFSSIGMFDNFFKNLGDPFPPFNTKTGNGLYYGHPYSSYAMKPGYVSYDDNGNIDVSINSLGFRGPEITREKPEGMFRIVALGASTTYGIYVSDEYTYPYQLEKKLDEKFGSDKIEVINAVWLVRLQQKVCIGCLLKFFPLIQI